MYSPIEGFFLVTNKGLIFEVKGNVHPPDRFIAYLRYVIDSSGDRKSDEGRFYRKIYPLVDRELYLRLKHPHFLQFDEKYNRVLQVVPKDQIRYVLNPVEGLDRLREPKGYNTSLQRSTIMLSERLVNLSGISWNSIGVTGSQLVGLTTEKSDIDLIIYGESSGMKLHKELSENYEVLEELERYDGESLRRHMEFRWGIDSPHSQILYTLEKMKVLQGLFNGFEFFIRLVKTADEIPYKYQDRLYYSLGTRVLKCCILDDSQSIYTPCEYKVKCEENPDLMFIISYRGRYTEHVRKGMDVEVKGRMERVVQNDGLEWSQLVLGEENGDYLIPLNQK